MVEAKVVQAHPVVARDHLGRSAGRHEPSTLQRAEDTAGQADGGVADADHPVSEDLGAHLGDDPGWVGEVDQMGAGGQPGDLFRDVHRSGDAPQRVVQAAEASGLLAEDTAAVGDGLLRRPALGAAGPDGAEDEISAGHGVVQVPSHPDHGSLRMPRCHRAQDGADHREPLRVCVPQPKLGDPLVALVPQEGAEHQRDAETAAA